MGTKHALINNGDDFVVVVEQEDEDKVNGLVEWFHDLGHTLVLETPVYVLEEIEFCQTHPVWDGEKWLVVRDPRVALAKDLSSCLDLSSDKAVRKYYAAISKCGLAVAGGIPIWDAFYRKLLSRSEGAKAHQGYEIKNSGLLRLSKNMSRQHREITPEARASFFSAFGVTPDEQREHERGSLADHIQPLGC
jgi:hypothetical protein